MKLRKSHTLPHIGDLYAKAGSPGLLWVVHRMLPNIDPSVPHVELLRLGDASTRVTISLPALVDIRMFEPVENDGAHDHQLAAMGFGHAGTGAGANDEPSAAARDADRAEAVRDGAARDEAAQDEAPEDETTQDETVAPVAVAGGDADDEDERVTRLYRSERADDTLESLERIDELPAEETAAPEPPRGAVPEDAAVPAFDPDADPDADPGAYATEADTSFNGPPDDDMPDDVVDPEDDAAPERDPATDDLFAAGEGTGEPEADDFQRMIAAADPDRVGMDVTADEAGDEDAEAGEDPERPADKTGRDDPREH